LRGRKEKYQKKVAFPDQGQAKRVSQRAAARRKSMQANSIAARVDGKRRKSLCGALRVSKQWRCLTLFSGKSSCKSVRCFVVAVAFKPNPHATQLR